MLCDFVKDNPVKFEILAKDNYYHISCKKCTFNIKILQTSVHEMSQYKFQQIMKDFDCAHICDKVV